MNVYPFDLVAAVAVGWALIFFGRLPTRFLRLEIFYRQIGFAGLAWTVVALLSPASILHLDILIGLICLWAWGRWRSDHGLSGRLWLSIASGLGISLAVVLVLAVTPDAYPVGWGSEILFLLEVYVGGAVIGLAYALYILTRRAATEAEIPISLLHSYGRLLFMLVLLRTGVLLLAPHVAALMTGHLMSPLGGWVIFLLLPVTWLAWRRIRGPAPSTSGTPLLIICVAGALAEVLAHL